MESRKGVGELLVRESLIDMKQLEEARKDQKEYGGKLISALVRKGFVKETELAEFLGQQYQLPTIDLTNFVVDPEAIKMLNRQVCEKHLVIPINKSGRSLVVAFSDPTNIFVKDDISLLTRMKIEVVVASESSILAAIEKYYGSNTKLQSIMSEIEDSGDEFTAVKADAQQIDQEVNIADGPIVKFVNAMLSEAIKLRASDIHVEPYEKRFRVRFRIDGVLHEKTQPPPGAAAAIVSRIKILSQMNIAERRRPQDGRLKVRLSRGSEIDFRVNCTPTLFGEKVVLRLLDKGNLQLDLEKLGFEPDVFDVFRKAIHLPQGMVLITGPTGSGKTTTIYSALAELNTTQSNLCTAENPVEFNLDGINQVQVNPEIGFTFSEALRAFLRQDPEIIMVGEIRDYETAEIAYKAASTGHLVVSTLHTNDAPSTVTRLVEMGLPPYIVGESTTLVVAQRLIKLNCSQCTMDTKVLPEALLSLGVKEEDLPKFNMLKKGEGCTECNGTGLKGRSPIFEVMRMTNEIKEAILKGASSFQLKQVAMQSQGMRTLRGSALLKLMRGLTTVEEVINCSVGDDA